MAIWQTEFKLIPQSTEASFDDIVFDTSSTTLLEQAFRRGESWCDDNWVYGALDGTCVELFWFEGKLDEIAVRIHVGEISMDEIVCIENFAAANDLAILHDNQIFDVTIDNVFTIVKQSKAFLYTRNPHKFFDSL